MRGVWLFLLPSSLRPYAYRLLFAAVAGIVVGGFAGRPVAHVAGGWLTLGAALAGGVVAARVAWVTRRR